MPAWEPEVGDVSDLERKPRQLGLTLVSTSSCLTPMRCCLLPAATWNSRPSHPQEPVEHGRESDAHQVRRRPPVHCSAVCVGPGCSGGPHDTWSLPLRSPGASRRTGHVIPSSRCSSAERAPGLGWGVREGFSEQMAFEVRTLRMRRDRPGLREGRRKQREQPSEKAP